MFQNQESQNSLFQMLHFNSYIFRKSLKSAALIYFCHRPFLKRYTQYKICIYSFESEYFGRVVSIFIHYRTYEVNILVTFSTKSRELLIHPVKWEPSNFFMMSESFFLVFSRSAYQNF